MTPIFELSNKRVFVAGHNGLVGRSLMRRLKRERVEIITASRQELDLVVRADVEAWMRQKQPDVVIIAAAKVGGIMANNLTPVDFLQDNLLIQTHLISAAHAIKVEKLLFLGSSCIYPKVTEQPITESSLLTGSLEPTNQWYALAKIAGLKLCEAYRQQYGADFIAAMPTNLYGPFDNFNLTASHVLPALLRKMHEAKQANRSHVEIWGSGRPRREFMHVDDLADACVFLLRHYSDKEPINIGTGQDISTLELANLMREIVGYLGELTFDTTKPDGTLLKRLDVGRLNRLGWNASIGLRDGINSTYKWYREHAATEFV